MDAKASSRLCRVVSTIVLAHAAGCGAPGDYAILAGTGQNHSVRAHHLRSISSGGWRFLTWSGAGVFACRRGTNPGEMQFDLSQTIRAVPPDGREPELGPPRVEACFVARRSRWSSEVLRIACHRGKMKPVERAGVFGFEVALPDVFHTGAAAVSGWTAGAGQFAMDVQLAIDGSKAILMRNIPLELVPPEFWAKSHVRPR